MPRIVVSPLAQVDIDEIWDYIARDSIPNADRFVEGIEQRFHFLADNPRVGLREMIFDLVCGASRMHAI